MTLLLILLGTTLILFIWGKFSPDVIALLSMLSLYLTGILNVKETLSGFSNSTVIMIAALFIVGEGLSQTGWTALVGQWFVQWAKNNAQRLLGIVFLCSGLLSGFISNTGTVATLLPIVVTAAWSAGTFPSKLLLPVAFSANIGGLLTLTGTPPNIIVSNTLVENGFEGFSFFESALIGLPLLLLSLLYFRYVGYKWLPEHNTTDKPVTLDREMHKWIEKYSIAHNVYHLRIHSDSPLINTKIGDWNFEETYTITVMRLRRQRLRPLQGISQFVEIPGPDTEMRSHDILTVKGLAKEVDKLALQLRLSVTPITAEKEVLQKELITQEVGMAEMMITPQSALVGKTFPFGHYLQQAGVQLLAASRDNGPLTGCITVKAGDAFVIRGRWETIEALTTVYDNLVICGSPEALYKNVAVITPKSYVALFTLVLLILLLSFNILSGAIATLVCAGIMILTGCVPIAKAYKSISWTSVVMIAAMIPMGVALQKTGVAQMAAHSLLAALGTLHPTAVLGGMFLLTSAFSQTISNSATAVLMALVALMASLELGVSTKPFMIVVAISASTAFLTPIGTTTNAMVMTVKGSICL